MHEGICDNDGRLRPESAAFFGMMAGGGELDRYLNVPAGTYILSVIAANAGGVSQPSNSVTLTFPAGTCTGAPGPPTDFQAWNIGPTVFVRWGPPASGAALTGYTVEVSGAYDGLFATTARTLFGVAGPGPYTLSVAAVNPCGSSAPTAAQTVVVP